MLWEFPFSDTQGKSIAISSLLDTIEKEYTRPFTQRYNSSALGHFSSDCVLRIGGIMP